MKVVFPRLVYAWIALCLVVVRPSTFVLAEGGAVSVPKPDLPFGDINIIVLTDVHSFVGGHPHEEDRNADLGDVLSFYQHVKAYCDSQGADLWFFMNGNWVRGTGLAMDGNATMLVPLIEEMPWDAVNLGNDEAYKSGVVEIMRDSMVPHFGEAFLTSNTLDSATMEPFGGGRYRLLKGNNNTVLVFGFLYNMHHPSSLLHVEHVADVLAEDWFRVVLRETEYDAICVLAHMDNDNLLVELILHKIREHTHEHMPVQFLTGHTHLRKFRKIETDLWARAMEAGGFLDTVGFISIPAKETANSVKKGEVGGLFRPQFLNASKKELKMRAGVETLLTEEGLALSNRITATRNSLGLDEVVGCPPRDYFLNRSIHAGDSVYKLWIDHVAPTQIFDRNKDCAMIISSDNFRYDIRGVSGTEDALTLDDVVALVPYMEPVYYIGEVPEWAVRRMNASMNTRSLNHHHLWPDYILAGQFERAGDKNKPYRLYTHEYNLPEIIEDLNRIYVNELKPSKTDFKDTLYWLAYAETSWQCQHHMEAKQLTPWFADIKELDEEASDGERTDGDMDMDIDLEKGQQQQHKNETTKKSKGSDLHYEGYEGYLPPAAIDKYGEKLPPGISPAVPHKPKPAPPPTPKKTKKIHQSAAALKAERMEHRKKVKRTVFKVLAFGIAGSLLLIPLYGLCRVFFPEKVRSGMSDETFYDMKEMRTLRRRGRGGGHKPLPTEIQMT